MSVIVRLESDVSVYDEFFLILVRSQLSIVFCFVLFFGFWFLFFVFLLADIEALTDCLISVAQYFIVFFISALYFIRVIVVIADWSCPLSYLDIAFMFHIEFLYFFASTNIIFLLYLTSLSLSLSLSLSYCYGLLGARKKTQKRKKVEQVYWINRTYIQNKSVNTADKVSVRNCLV